MARNATHSFRFTITAPSKEDNYAFQWRMRVEEVTTPGGIRPDLTVGVNGAWSGSGWFGGATTRRTIRMEKDTSPSFGDADVDDQTWTQNKRPRSPGRRTRRSRP